MLKLDFQRAVLQRIPKIAAHPERDWRDLLFVCDEYHAFATVGEDRSHRRRAHVRAVASGAPDSDRRHPERQLAAIGAAGRRELAHAAAVFPDEVVPGHERRVHGESRRRSVRPPRSAQSALHAVGGRPGRAHLAADGPRDRREADGQRQQELCAASRVHLLASGLHGACRTPRRSRCRTTGSIRCPRSSAT